MARPNPLAQPAFAKEVAALFVSGATREEMCKHFGVSDPYTITRWRRDPRVKAHAMKMIEDRILQVTRKVDSVISSRLEYADKMSIPELLAIRKEFLGGALRAQTEKADADTVNEAQSWLEANPDAADQLEKLLSGEVAHPVIPTEAQSG